MKNKGLIFVLIAVFSVVGLSQTHAASFRQDHVKAYITQPAEAVAFSYVPTYLDYVLPQSFATFSDVTYVNWGLPTGLPYPYDSYYNIRNRRCRVQSLPFTIGGGTQLYVNLTIVGTSYTIMWPVNEVNPYGTTDYLIKTT